MLFVYETLTCFYRHIIYTCTCVHMNLQVLIYILVHEQSCIYIILRALQSILEGVGSDHVILASVCTFTLCVYSGRCGKAHYLNIVDQLGPTPWSVQGYGR